MNNNNEYKSFNNQNEHNFSINNSVDINKSI